MSAGRRVLAQALIAGVFIASVGSRNVSLLITFGTLVRFYPRWAMALLAMTGTTVFVYLMLDPALLDALDTLMSFRLTMWNGALSDPMQASRVEVIEGERLAVDSYYIEAYIYAGQFAVPLMLAWLAGVWPRFCVAGRRSTQAPRHWPC